MALSPGTYGGKPLNAKQLNHAQTIYQVGQDMGASGRDIMIAIMTAMQESRLRNLNRGDRDSLGLFQQRPSQGWGTPDQITNPQYAARQFFRRLLNISGRNQLQPTQAAQRVQKSAFPNAYATWQSMASAVVSAIGGNPGSVDYAGNAGSNDNISGIVEFITDRGNWIRIGYFLLGVGLLITGIVVYMGGNAGDIAGKITGVGKAVKGVRQ